MNATDETLPPTNATAEHGNVSVTVTSRHTHCASGARLPAGSYPPRRCTTSCRCPKAGHIRRITSWRYVRPAILGLLWVTTTGIIENPFDGGRGGLNLRSLPSRATAWGHARKIALSSWVYKNLMGGWRPRRRMVQTGAAWTGADRRKSPPEIIVSKAIQAEFTCNLRLLE